MRLVALAAVVLAIGPLMLAALFGLSALVLFFAAILYIVALCLMPMPPDRPDDPVL
jgi:hypothetical protein